MANMEMLDDRHCQTAYKQHISFVVQILTEGTSPGTLDANTLLHLEVNMGPNPAPVHVSGTIGHITVDDLWRLFGSELLSESASSLTISADHPPSGTGLGVQINVPMTSVNTEVTSNLIAQSGHSVAAQRNEGDANVTTTASGVETWALPPVPSSEGTSSNTNNNMENSAGGSRMPVTCICRGCAFEVFLHELYPWWAWEQKKVLNAAEAEEAVAAALTASSSSWDESGS